MKSRHYCSADVSGSNVVIQGNNDVHVCGKAMCIICRSSWGDPEKYTIYCKDHLPATINDGSKKEREDETNTGSIHKRNQNIKINKGGGRKRNSRKSVSNKNDPVICDVSVNQRSTRSSKKRKT